MADYEIYQARADARRALEVAETESPFTITVKFVGGLTETQKSAFKQAADRWARIIVGDLPDVTLDGEWIDDVLILAEGTAIDGVGQVLGEAGPTHVRVGGPPCRGVMRFDSADLGAMESEGTLVDVITHEMGHVLGIGTLWEGLVAGVGSEDPRYTGPVAVAEFEALQQDGGSETVPVENVGGEGSRDSHWRESVFRNELMSSAIGGVGNPISRLTAASLIDLGYEVDLDAAEPYRLPTGGLEGVEPAVRRGRFLRPRVTVVAPEESAPAT